MSAGNGQHSEMKKRMCLIQSINGAGWCSNSIIAVPTLPKMQLENCQL
jgi:hypothetical protein